MLQYCKPKKTIVLYHMHKEKEDNLSKTLSRPKNEIPMKKEKM